MVYPKEDYTTPKKKMRSIIFINKRIATHSWLQVNFSSSDITAAQAQTAAGRVLIINIYNDITHAGSIDHVLQTMWVRARAGGDSVGTEHIIWLGDFNRHHLMWATMHISSQGPTSTRHSISSMLLLS